MARAAAALARTRARPSRTRHAQHAQTHRWQLDHAKRAGPSIAATMKAANAAISAAVSVNRWAQPSSRDFWSVASLLRSGPGAHTLHKTGVVARKRLNRSRCCRFGAGVASAARVLSNTLVLGVDRVRAMCLADPSSAAPLPARRPLSPRRVHSSACAPSTCQTPSAACPARSKRRSSRIVAQKKATTTSSGTSLERGRYYPLDPAAREPRRRSSRPRTRRARGLRGSSLLRRGGRNDPLGTSPSQTRSRCRRCSTAAAAARAR